VVDNDAMNIDETLAVATEGDVLVARLSGEIDLANAKPIGSAISGAVNNELAGVVVDLSDVTYLDSSGVHLIFDLAERLAARQQVLALAVPEGARIRRVLELVNVDSVAVVEPTPEGARARAAGDTEGAG
jgi:anti-anti-sigma factor